MPLNAFTFANVPASTTDRILVTGIPNRFILVKGVACEAGAVATNITFNTKPSGTLGTAISGVFQIGANGGFTLPYNEFGFFQTSIGDSLSVTTGAGSTVGVQIIYEVRDQSGFILQSAAVFSPSNISNLELWLDATVGTWQDLAGTTAAVANNDPVFRWDDRSGKARNAIASSSAARPLVKTANQNNRNGVQFTGGTHFMDSTIPSIPQPYTMVAVHKVLTNTPISGLWTDDGVNEWWTWFGNNYFFVEQNGAFSCDSVFTSYSAAARMHFAQMAQGANQSIYWLDNLGPNAKTATVNPSLDNVHLGQKQSGYSAVNQTYNEFMIYSKVLTDQERNDLTTYLNTKWTVY